MKRAWSNLASLGAQELMRWGDRCRSLGTPTAGPLSRILDEGVVGASIRPAGTHSDPTLAAMIRDEPVYNTDRAVKELKEQNPELGEVVEAAYLRGESVSQDRLLTAQNWVGSWLLMEGKIPHVVGDAEVAPR